MGMTRSTDAASTWSSRASVGVSWCVPLGVESRRVARSTSTSPPSRRDLRVTDRGAPQDALDAGDELIGVEGLRHVVLGVELERADLRLGGVDGREDDDRQVGDLLHPAAELEAVHPGHHQVDDQQGRPRALELLERGGAGRRGADVVAGARDAAGDRRQQGEVVVDEEDGRPNRRQHPRCPRRP